MLEFLLHLYQGDGHRGLGYSAINSARSALSTIIFLDGRPIGQHPLVVRFLRAVFNERPALPRYSITWDVDLVLNYIRSLGPSKKMSLTLLSHKLTMLLVLLAGQRCQTVHLFDIRNMNLSFSYVRFSVGDVLKTSGPGRHVAQVSYKAYAPDRRLCVVTALKWYLRRTLERRGNVKRLLITLRPPFKAVSRDTVRRWVRTCMANAGLDLSIFAPHSTRAASTSKAVTKVPLLTICKTAGWAGDSVFTKYYNKPVDTSLEFSNAVLH